MSAVSQVFVSGVILGFSLAAPPGPINASAAQQIGRSTWFAGWLTELGGTTADVIFFMVTFYGLANLVTAQLRSTLLVVGGALMLYLASKAIRKTEPMLATPKNGRSRFPYLIGLSIGLTSPYQLGWWVTVGMNMVTEFGLSIALGFFTGVIAWTLMFAWSVSAGISRYPWLGRLIRYASAAIMVAFGSWFVLIGALALL